jgi:hypothetical protein
MHALSVHASSHLQPPLGQGVKSAFCTTEPSPQQMSTCSSLVVIGDSSAQMISLSLSLSLSLMTCLSSIIRSVGSLLGLTFYKRSHHNAGNEKGAVSGSCYWHYCSHGRHMSHVVIWCRPDFHRRLGQVCQGLGPSRLPIWRWSSTLLRSQQRRIWGHGLLLASELA